MYQVGGQAVLGRQSAYATPWLTERHGYDPTCLLPSVEVVAVSQAPSPESNPNSPLPVTTMVGLYPTIES